MSCLVTFSRSVAVTAGANHSLGLRADGSVACWGLNECGEAPPGGVPGPIAAEWILVMGHD